MESNGNNGRDLNGKFLPGHGGYKRAGLPEIQRETRQKLWAFFSQKIDRLPEIFDELSPNNQARLLILTAEFFTPRVREIIIDSTDEELRASIDWTKLSPAAFKEVLALTTIHNNGNKPG